MTEQLNGETTNGECAAPTFVLVHGAFHGGWCWRQVAAQLRTRGYHVTTPTQTGLGERKHLLSSTISLETFILDIVNHIEAEDLTEVVLVGHSFGGLTVAGVADRIPARIRRLVFLDASIAESGQNHLDVLTAEAAATRRASASDAEMMPPCVSAFGIPLDHPLAPWVQERLTPQPFSVYESRLFLKNPLGNGIPATYIAATAPAYEPLKFVRAWVRRERPNWTWTDIATGHDVMVTAPLEVARMLSAC